MTVDQDVAQAVVELGEMALALGRVDRVTFHEDGTTPESDTDHTVMLGLVAPAFAARFLPELDLGKIAQYALVHDLVEVYAGDVSTLRITPRQLAEKHRREREAKAIIDAQFCRSLPWVPIMIEAYEAQEDLESRFVWAMDKLLPKVTHILNKGVTPHADHVSAQEMTERLDRQTREMDRRLAGAMDPMLELYDIMRKMLFESVYGEGART